MGDHSPAHIKIGGTIAKEDAQRLLDACDSDAAWHDYDAGKPELTGTASEQLAQLYALSLLDREPLTCLTICSSQAVGGVFHAVEGVCRTLNLSYDRHSDAYYEFNAVWDCWRPGYSHPLHIASDQDASRLVDADSVIRAYKALMEGSWHECLHFLHPIVTPLITLGEVPAFTILQ